jgi:2-iminobutanoate/2-iminopropanoate deaminase
MSKTVLQSSSVAIPRGIMSQGIAVPAGRMVFASGQVARDVDGSLVGPGDIRAQTRKTLENLQAVLAEGGATMDDVVKVTVFVTSLSEHFAAIHEVRREFFKSDYPASTLVEISSLVDPEMLIEIEAIAVTQ